MNNHKTTKFGNLWPGRIPANARKAGRVITALFAGAAMVLVLSNCASSSSRACQTPFPHQAVSSVALATPIVRFVDVKSGYPIHATPERTSQIRTAMASALAAQLTAMGVTTRASGGSTLASTLTVHEGEGGTWNPNTGQITATSSRLELDLRLNTGSSGRVLWEQHALLRDAMDPSYSKLAKLAVIAFAKQP